MLHKIYSRTKYNAAKIQFYAKYNAAHKIMLHKIYSCTKCNSAQIYSRTQYNVQYGGAVWCAKGHLIVHLATLTHNPADPFAL